MPWIEANGASLRYELSGSGKETLVLVHEAGGCLESYEDALSGTISALPVPLGLQYAHLVYGVGPHEFVDTVLPFFKGVTG